MKKVSPPKKAKVTGLNLLGELIEYEFELMTAAVGLPLFHEEMMGIVGFCKQILEHLNEDEEKQNVSAVAFTCRHCFETKKLVELREKLLKGVRASDPFDVYAALYHAFLANYGATLTPLLEALDKQGKDTSTKSEETETETMDQE